MPTEPSVCHCLVVMLLPLPPLWAYLQIFDYPLQVLPSLLQLLTFLQLLSLLQLLQLLPPQCWTPIP